MENIIKSLSYEKQQHFVKIQKKNINDVTQNEIIEINDFVLNDSDQQQSNDN